MAALLRLRSTFTSWNLADNIYNYSTRRYCTSSFAPPSAPPYDVLFCGSDAFACAALERLLGSTGVCRSIHVLTPPDVLHAWGARRMRVSPVKQLAEHMHVPVSTVPKEGLEAFTLPPSICESKSPLLITASFGHRIPTSMLSHFPSTSLAINLHPSMLPDLRGAAPLQWAIARQYTQTGITVQQLHPTHFDRGGILKQVIVNIPTSCTYPALVEELAPRGAELLVDVVARLPECHARLIPQDSTHATRAPKLAPRFSQIRWDAWDAAMIDARMRAFGYAQPLTTTLIPATSQFSPAPCIIHEGHVLLETPSEAKSLEKPGQGVYVSHGGFLAFKTISGMYGITRIQTRGKPARLSQDWWRGFRDRADDQGRIQFA